MMRRWCFHGMAFAWLLAAAGPPAGAADLGVVYLQEKRETKKAADSQNIQNFFDFFGTHAHFGLSYDISAGPDTPKGKCVSQRWVFKEKMPTLGMDNPSPCNWYTQGFFDIIVDGEGLHEYPAEFKVVRRGGPDALLDAVWKTPKADVTARFLLRDGDDKLLMEAVITPKAEPQSIQVRLLCYPNGFYGDKDRWIDTAGRSVQHDKTVQLDPQKEPWVIYYDKALSGDKIVGPCGLLYLPEEVRSATVNVTGYPIWTMIDYPPASRKLHLAIYDFTDFKKNDENIAYLKKNGESFLTDLRAVAALDWGKAVELPARIPAGRFKEGLVETAPTPFDQMTNEIVLPHVKWAKPYAKGKIKLFAFAPRWSQRETVELAQRLDVEYDTMSFSSPSEVYDPRELGIYGSYDLYGYPKRSALTELAKLRRMLVDGKYDCMIVGDIKMEALPTYFFDAIMKKVEGGMGLIVTGHNKMFVDALQAKASAGDDRFVVRAVPIEHLPVLNEYSQDPREKLHLFDSYTHGGGRALIVRYPCGGGYTNQYLTPVPTKSPEFQLPDYEYYQSMVAKAVLWAARKEPDAAIESISPQNTLNVRSTREMKNVDVEYVIHDRPNFEEHKGKLKADLPAGESRHTLDIPRLKPGEHFIDVTLRKDGKVIDWGSGWFTTESDVAIGEIAIDPGERGDGARLTGRVLLKGAPAEGKLQVELWDNLDRLLGRTQQTIDRNTKEVPFEFGLHRPLTMLHRLRLIMADDKGILDWREKEFPIADRNWDDWSFVVWSSGQNLFVRDGINYVVSRMGVDAMDNTGLTGGDADTTAQSCRNAARHNIRSIPYITRIASMQETGNVRKPCLTDPKHLAEWTAGLKDRARGAAPYGMLGYTLGDENFLVHRRLDVCFSETCKADFREYLKRIYENLDALNKEWDSQHKSWDEVEPIDLEEALKTKRLARWADHRMHMEEVFTRAHALGRAAIRESDPRARVGFDGVFTLESYHGYNFYKLCQACDLCQVYRGHLNQMEYLRCFSKPGSLLGAWHNTIGNKDEISAKRVTWDLLLHGFNSSWYWTTYNCGCATNFPDLRPTPQFKWMAEVNNEVKAGLGKLLMNAERLNDGVAIHYSQPSVHAQTILKDYTERIHNAAIVAMEDAGLQYDFLAGEQIEAGKLSDYKALLLPASHAISQKEAAAFRRFVEAGGLLIADVRPGIMDGHCKPASPGLLDDLFGIKRGSERQPGAAEETIQLTTGGEIPIPPDDTTVALAGAEAMAKGSQSACPCVTTRKVGKGRAVLLNFPLQPYYNLRNDVKEGTVRKLIVGILAEAGIKSQLKILCNGEDVNACETVFFRNGDIDYVAIVKDDDITDPGDRDVEIVFPKKATIYDVRQKKLLGETDRAKTRITPGDPKIFALMPSAVKAVNATVTQKECHPGDTVEYAVSIETEGGEIKGRHCVRMEVVDPKGASRHHYARNLLMDRSGAKEKLSLAYNDPVGKWGLKFTDVVSGKSSIVNVSVAE